ncbi:hypothetical protein OG393_10670 [Streptomyces sp. NBC_01216]|uniref:hypothetical protein n=1 Tax=Streptomyces sp. NBC_01216 TaxID=2903778 RepID=UPI002E11FE42|nr:hypothetical protein OG393_10670 [Streptomyces sp. NBC_01216]
MSFDDEWSELKREVSRESPHTRLHQVASGGSGLGGDANLANLSVNQDKLGAIGNAAYALRGRLVKDGIHARTTTEEAATSMSGHGFRTGAAMTTVQETWGSQLSTLLDACAHVSNHLDYSAARHAQDEEDIRTALTTGAISGHFT